jgi:hypothetical protein
LTAEQLLEIPHAIFGKAPRYRERQVKKDGHLSWQLKLKRKTDRPNARH